MKKQFLFATFIFTFFQVFLTSAQTTYQTYNDNNYQNGCDNLIPIENGHVAYTYNSSIKLSSTVPLTLVLGWNTSDQSFNPGNSLYMFYYYASENQWLRKKIFSVSDINSSNLVDDPFSSDTNQKLLILEIPPLTINDLGYSSASPAYGYRFKWSTETETSPWGPSATFENTPNTMPDFKISRESNTSPVNTTLNSIVHLNPGSTGNILNFSGIPNIIYKVFSPSGTVLLNDVIPSSGNFSIDRSSLNYPVSISVQQIDANCNTSSSLNIVTYNYPELIVSNSASGFTSATPLFNGTGSANSTFLLSIKKTRDLNSIEGKCVSNCDIENATISVNSSGVWSYQVNSPLTLGDYQLTFSQFVSGAQLNIPSSIKNIQILYKLPQSINNITPITYNENQSSAVFPFSTFQETNLDSYLTEYVKLEIVPPADLNDKFVIGYDQNNPAGPPESYPFLTNGKSTFLTNLLAAYPTSKGGAVTIGNAMGNLTSISSSNFKYYSTYPSLYYTNQYTLIGTNGERVMNTWKQIPTGFGDPYNWTVNVNQTSYTHTTSDRYEGYNVPSELSVVTKNPNDVLSYQITPSTVVENCFIKADEIAFVKNGNEYTPKSLPNDARVPDVNAHTRLRKWEITSILHSISYVCSGDLIDTDQTIARNFTAKLYKADGTFDIINATVNVIPSPDMGSVSWGGLGVTQTEGGFNGALNYLDKIETVNNDNPLGQQTFNALLRDSDFNSTLTVNVETSTGFEHTLTEDIPNNTKTYTCPYYTLTVPRTVTNSNTIYSGQSVYMPFVINYTDFDQFTALPNPVNTLRFKFYSPNGTYTGWVGNNINFGFVIDDIVFNATPNYSSANSITNLPTSSLFTVNTADFVDGDLSQKGFKSVTLKIKDAQRFLDEIVAVDGSDVLITKNASGTTTSGFTWVNTLTNSSTATLKISFPTALSNVQFTNLINSLVYKIKFGSLNKWTDGIRSVEIAQIEKYASSNNVKDYNLNFVSELNVVGNADIYFENYNVTFNPFYEHNSITTLTGFIPPSDYSGYTLTFSPDGNQDNVADMLSYDVFDFSSTDVSTSNGTISVNETVVGNFVIANNKIIVTFSGGTTAQVDKVIKALKFSVNTNDPTYRGLQVLWDLTNTIQQVNSGTFFLVVPENDAPSASTSLTTQLLYRTETNSTYGVSIFDNNTFVIQQNLLEQNQDEPQKLKKIKLNIKNLSSATVLRNISGQVIPCEYILYNNQQIPIGRVQNFQSAGYATSYTNNGLNFDFEYVGATEVNLLITDNDVTDNVNLVTELLTLKFYVNTTNASSYDPTTFSNTSTRQFRITYIEDSGYDDGVRNNNHQTLSSNNYIELRFDPSARNNSPYITNTLNLATNWNPKTAGNPSETTFTWLGPGSIYGPNAASYNSSSVLEYQASKGSKLLWNMSGYLSPGFEDVGQFISQIKVKVTNILDTASEKLQIGTSTINLNANSSGTLLLNGVTINYSSVYASNASEITFSGFTSTVKPEALLNTLKYGHSSATPTIGQRTIFISELKDNVNDAFSNTVIDYTVSSNWSGKIKINVITPLPDAFSVSWNASYAYSVNENSSTTAAMVLKVNGNPTTSYPFTYNGVSCIVHKIIFKNTVSNSEILDSRLNVNIGTSGKIVKDPAGLGAGYYLILPIANTYNNEEYTITLNSVDNTLIDGNYSATISIYDSYNSGNTSFNSNQPNYILGDVPTISITDDEFPTFTATTNTLSVVEGQTVTVDLSINIFPASNNQSYELDMTNTGTNARLGISPAHTYFRRVAGTTTPVDTKTVSVTFTAPQNNNLDGNTTVPVTFTLEDLWYLNSSLLRAGTVVPPTTPFSGLTQTININVIDDDVPLIVPSVSPVIISETIGANTATSGIKLSAAPVGNVTINLTSASSDFTFSPASMTFTSSNWSTNQTLTITSVNNTLIDGLKTGTIVMTDPANVYNQPYPITVKVLDDDAKILITSLKNGGTYPTQTKTNDFYYTYNLISNPNVTFQVALPAQPVSDVTITYAIPDVSISAPTAINYTLISNVSPANNTLTFTPSNWNIPQTITLKKSTSPMLSNLMNFSATSSGIINNTGAKITLTSAMGAVSNPYPPETIYYDMLKEPLPTLGNTLSYSWGSVLSNTAICSAVNGATINYQLTAADISQLTAFGLTKDDISVKIQLPYIVPVKNAAGTAYLSYSAGNGFGYPAGQVVTTNSLNASGSVSLVNGAMGTSYTIDPIYTTRSSTSDFNSSGLASPLFSQNLLKAVYTPAIPSNSSTAYTTVYLKNNPSAIIKTFSSQFSIYQGVPDCSVSTPVITAAYPDNLVGTVTNAPANSVVTAYAADQTTVIGTGIVTATGTFQVSFTNNQAIGAQVYVKVQSWALSPISLPATVQGDNVAPNPPTILLDPASDSGSSNSDLVTKVTLPTLKGFTEGNATVKIYDNAATPNLIATVTADAIGNYSYTFTSVLSEGVKTFKATATDATGNVSAYSISPLVFTVDITPPTATFTAPFTQSSISSVTLNSEFLSSNAITINGSTYNFSLLPTTSCSGMPFANNFGGGWYASTINQSWCNILEPNEIGSSQSITLTVSTDNYFDGNNYRLKIYYGSGNTLLGTLPGTKVSTGLFTFTIPATVFASYSSQGLKYSIEGKEKYSPYNYYDISSGGGTQTTTPTYFNITIDANYYYTNDANVATKITGYPNFSKTVTLNSAITTTGTYPANLTVTDIAGNIATISQNYIVPLSSPTIQLATSSDVGTWNNDNLTNKKRPQFTGTAPLNTTVKITINNIDYTGAVDGSGNYSITPSADLPQGNYTVSAVAIDVNNNQSLPVTTSVSIDLTLPAITATGPTTLDGQNPTLSGQAEIFSVVSVEINGTTYTKNVGATTSGMPVNKILYYGTYTLNQSWFNILEAHEVKDPQKLIMTEVTDNFNYFDASYRLKIMDADGTTVLSTISPSSSLNGSYEFPISLALMKTMLTKSYPATGFKYVIEGLRTSDHTTWSSIVSSNDGALVFQSPLSGINSYSNDANTSTLLTQNNFPSVAWNIPITIGVGTFPALISAKDWAGNINTLASIDYTKNVYVAPPSLRLDAITDTGFMNSDGITNTSNPMLSGTVNTGLTVQLYASDGTTTIGSPITPDGSGNWSYTFSGLAAGTYTYKAKALDGSGNFSTLVSTTIVIDLTAPTLTASNMSIDKSTMLITGSAEQFTKVSTSVNSINYSTIQKPIICSTVGGFNGVVPSWCKYLEHYETMIDQTVKLFNSNLNATNKKGRITFTLANSTTQSYEYTITNSNIANTTANIVIPASFLQTLIPSDYPNGISYTTSYYNGSAWISLSGNNYVGIIPIGGLNQYYSNDNITTPTLTTIPIDSSWSFTLPSNTPDGIFNATVSVEDVAGNQTTTNVIYVLISPPTISLDPASDSGTSNKDLLTKNSLPILKGVTSLGTTVQLYNNSGVAFGAPIIPDGTGNWTYTYTSPLASGSITVSAKAINSNGDYSSASILTFVVDLVSPIVSGIALNNTANPPFISGVSENFSTINATVNGNTYTINNRPICSVSPTAVTAYWGTSWTFENSWCKILEADEVLSAQSITVKLLPVNTSAWQYIRTSAHNMQLRIFDSSGSNPIKTIQVAGNEQNIYVFNLDASFLQSLKKNNYSASGVPFQVEFYDAGYTNTYTNINSGSFKYYFLIDETNYYSNDGNTANIISGTPANITWTIPLTAGDYSASSFAITATDLSGNIGTLTYAPIGAPVLAASNGTSVTGTAEANSSVIISITSGGTTTTTTVTADSSGNFTYTPSPALADGTTLTATATDSSGNVSSVSNTVTVDAQAPAAPVLAASNGTSVTGTAEANSSVIISITSGGTTTTTTVTADSSGNFTYTPSPALADGTTLTATATDSSGNVSSVSNTVTVDAQAPAAPVLAASNGTSVTGTAEANSSVIISITSGGTTTTTTVTADSSGNFTYTPSPALADGTTLTATATDSSGNVSSVSNTVTVDAQAPAAPVLAASNGTSVTGTAEANSSVIISITSGGTTTTTTVTADSSGNFTYTPSPALADGTTLTATATDSSGNVSSVSNTVTIDAQAPAAPVLAASNGTSVTGTAEANSSVIISITSGGTTTTTTVTADSSGNFTYTPSPALADGTTLTATATDSSGNVSSVSNTVTVDAQAPAAPVLAASNGTSVTGTAEANSSVIISITSGGTTTTTTVTADSSGNFTYTPSPALADGTTLTATATDSSGNVSSVSNTVTIDAQAPAAPVLAASNGTSVTGTAEANSSVIISITSGGTTTTTTVTADSSGNFTYTPSPALADGTTLTATATDSSGNVSSVSNTVTVDAQAPAAPVLAASNGTSVTGTAEANSSVIISITSGGTTTTTTVTADSSGNFTYTPSPALSNGTTLTATATDSSGNVSSVSNTVTVDAQAPAAPVLAASNGTSVTGTAEANSSVIISITSGGTTTTTTVTADSSGNFTYTPSPALADGTTLTATATDSSGNVSSVSNTVTVDAQAPAAPVLAASNGTSVTGTAEANSSVIISITSGGTTTTTTVTADSSGNFTYTPSPALADGTTLTATATDSSGNVSSVSNTVTVDAQAPAAPVLAASNGTSVTGTAEANSSVIISITSGGTTTTTTVTADSSGNFTYTPSPALADGTTLTATATDSSGNVSSVSNTVTVDAQAPAAPVLAASNGTSVTGTAEANSSVIISITSGGTTTTTTVTADSSGNFTYTPSPALADGTTLTATATDSSGNVSSVSNTVTVDAQAPAAPVLAASNGTSVTGTAEANSSVIISITSGGTTTTTTVTADSSGNFTYTPSPALADGTTLTATATDSSGNVSSVSNTVTVDAQAPAAPVLAASNGTSVTGTAEANSSVIISITSGGTTTTTTVTADSSGNFTYTPSPALADGTTLTATATDSSGNVSSVSNTVTIDAQAPAAPVLAASNGTSVTGTAEANSSVIISITSGGTTTTTTVTADSSGNFTYTPSPALADGTTLTATATDSSGNVSSVSNTVTVDAQAPAAPVLAASNGTSVTGTAEANSSVIISITSGGTTTTTTVTADSSGNFTYTPSPALSNGTTLTATATDSSGNVSSVSNTVTVDAQAPAAPVVTAIISNITTPTITGTAESNSSVSLVINGVTYYTTSDSSGIWSVTVTTPLPEGIYTASATASDATGNTSSVGTASIVIDTTAPNPPLISPIATNDGTITGTAEVNSTITILINGATYIGLTDSSGNYSIDIIPTNITTDGTYAVTVTATDVAGNTSNISTSSLSIDTTAPTAPVLAASNGTSVTGTAEANSSVIISITSGGTTTTTTVTADSSGNFTYTPSPALADGTTLTATATDSSGNVSSVSNTVTVDNTPALITGPSGVAGDSNTSISINENSTTVFTFITNETVSWSLNGGEDITKFSINSSGVLQFIVAPDYENHTDGATTGSNTYIVVVKSTDTAGNVSTQTVTVTVLDIDDTPPIITGPSGGAGAIASVKTIMENTVGIHLFTANETATWSISGGTESNLFTISADGKLIFTGIPDYENPLDIDHNNTYEVVVKATDTAGNFSIQTVTVTIANTSDYTIPLLDSDSDAIDNSADLDDDNDGVLDITEMCNAKLNFTGLTTGGTTYALGNNLVTQAKSTGATFSGDANGNLKILVSNSNITYSNVYLDLNFTKPTVLKFVHGTNTGFGNFDTGDVWELVSTGASYTIADPNGDVTVTNNTAGTMTFGSLYPANSTNINEPWMITTSAVTSIRVKLVRGNPASNIKIITNCNLDTDNDDVINSLDLDSDGDNCPDAKESGVTGVLVSDAVAQGPYGANGLADGIETGTETGIVAYTSTYATQALVADTVPPTITTQPINTIVFEGNPLQLSVLATAVSGRTLTYQWYKGNAVITGATSATYLVAPYSSTSDVANYYCVISYLNSCLSTTSNVVGVTLVSQPISDANCENSAATFSVVPSSTLGVSYQWTKDGVNLNGATSSSIVISNLNASDSGEYKCKVTLGGLTEISNGAQLTVFTNNKYTVANQTLCSGLSPFTLNASNIVGTSGSTMIKWQRSVDDGVNWVDVSGNMDGISYSNYTTNALVFSELPTNIDGYQYRIVSANGNCTETSTGAILTINSSPVAPTVVVTDPTCTDPTGTITISSPTGSGLLYSIDGSTYVNTTGIFTGVTSGTYSVTVKNASGCISTAMSSVIGVQPSTPVAPTVVVTDPTCTTSTGTITISSPTGSGLLYSIDGSTYVNTTGIFTGVTSGTYSVTVKNTSGCISTATSSVIGVQPSTPVAPTVVVTDPTCTTSTGTITISSPTGSGLLYSIDGITYVNTTGIFTGVTSGTYSVTVKNASGCISIATSSVIGVQPSTPVAPTVVVTDPTCTDPTGTITISSPTGSGLLYSIDGSTYVNTTGIFTGVTSGTYSVTVKNASGCISTATSSVIGVQPSTPVAPTVVVTDPTCTTSTGTITISSPTGSGLLYSIDGSTYVNTTGIFTGVTSGTYSVTVKNTSGCISTATSSVIGVQPSTPVAPTVVVTDPTCTTSTGTITISSPTGSGLLYSIDGITYVNTTGIFTGVTSGTYSVTVKNASGCISIATSSVIGVQPSTPVAPTVVVTDPTCTDPTGTITISSPTGSGLLYSIDGSTYVNTTGIFTGVTSGTYSVTVKNASGCISTAMSAVIGVQPSTPVAPTVVVTDPTCTTSTGTITISSPTGSGLLYSIDGITYVNTTGIFTGVTSGTYSVTVKNASGCISIATSSVIGVQPSTPVAPTVVVTDPTCTDPTGTITISSPTGSGLLYSIDGSTYVNTTGIFTGVTSGTYSVTVKNASGCISTATSAVIGVQPSTPVAPTVVVTDPTCTTSTGTITISSPTGSGLLYSIDGITYVNTTGIFTGVTSGTYSVTVKNASGCISIATSSVIGVQPSTPVAPTVVVTDPTCTDPTGTITISSPTGSGLLYSIDGSTYVNTTGIFTGVTSGTYSVTVKNASGCISTATSSVIGVQPSTPVAPTVVVTDPTCTTSTGTITISSPTGSGLLYSIDGSTYVNTIGIFTGVTSGTYSVTVKNASGCISIAVSVIIISQSTLICDSDGDSVLDTQEILDGTDPNNSCSFLINSVNYINVSSAWLNLDCDVDGLTNSQEFSLGTNLLNADTDGDGVIDGTEIIDETDPINPCESISAHVTKSFSESFLIGDCDNDGLLNGNEIGLNPIKPSDSNGNGIPDYLEENNHSISEDDLEIFTAVSPNGDGENDVFVIRNIENYPNNTVSIYNRWGILVYEVDGYGQNNRFFKGISEGRMTINQQDELPVGTYFYFIRYKNKVNEQKQRSGYLYINR